MQNHSHLVTVFLPTVTACTDHSIIQPDNIFCFLIIDSKNRINLIFLLNNTSISLTNGGQNEK